MLSDFHVHTSFSGDSMEKPERQIEQAISLGMESICITDHMDIGASAGNGSLMEFDILEYMNTLSRLQRQYQGIIDLRIGMELGLDPIHEKQIWDCAASASFDYIIGSIHIVDGMDPYFPEYFQKYETEAGYRRYFDCCLEHIRMFDCFDCLGHIDYILRYGSFVPDGYPASYMDQIEPILKLLIEKGKGIECNTAGIRKGLGFPNPHLDIIKRYLSMGGEILCIGSDAHAAQDLGRDFSSLSCLLKDCGAKYYTVFHERQPVFLPL